MIKSHTYYSLEQALKSISNPLLDNDKTPVINKRNE